MSKVALDEVCEAMLALVTSTYGKKNLKPMDVTRALIEQFGADRCDKDLCKKAIRELVDTGRLTYKYEGGSFLTLPPATT
jgi:hypothetical protein